MPRLYFHLHNGTGMLLDEDGIEIAPETMHIRALIEARALIADEALNGQIDLRQRIEVKDGNGLVLHSLPFAEAVEIIAPH